MRFELIRLGYTALTHENYNSSIKLTKQTEFISVSVRDLKREENNNFQVHKVRNICKPTVCFVRAELGNTSANRVVALTQVHS